MRRRKDPPGYPGDEYIMRRFYEMKEVLRESAGITCEELEKRFLLDREKPSKIRPQCAAQWASDFGLCGRNRT